MLTYMNKFCTVELLYSYTSGGGAHLIMIHYSVNVLFINIYCPFEFMFIISKIDHLFNNLLDFNISAIIYKIVWDFSFF